MFDHRRPRVTTDRVRRVGAWLPILLVLTLSAACGSGSGSTTTTTSHADLSDRIVRSFERLERMRQPDWSGRRTAG